MEVLFFHDGIEKFLYTIEESTRAKVIRCIMLLESYGQNLGMPHSKHIVEGIFELRVRGTQEIRILYIFHKRSVYLLHAFVKKTDRISRKDLEAARKRKKLVDDI